MLITLRAFKRVNTRNEGRERDSSLKVHCIFYCIRMTTSNLQRLRNCG